MKKSLVALLALSFTIACQKSGDGTSNTLFLSEVYKNGQLDIAYLFSTQRQLLQQNDYVVNNGQSNLALYATYEYGPNGYIKHRKIFTANDTLNNRYELTYDNSNRLSRMDWIWTANVAHDYRVYEYDPENRITKITEKLSATNANQAYSEYEYDDQGRLKAQHRYYWQSNKWVKNYDYEFIPAGKNVYNHWQKFMTSPFDFYRSELNYASRKAWFYDNSGNVTTEYKDSATEKQYNGSGYLVKQKITRSYTKPVKPDEITEMQYDYIH